MRTEEINDTYDRVRETSPAAANMRIDAEMAASLARYRHLSPAAIDQRLHELDREWDIERALEVNASTLALTGLVLGITSNRKWLLLPGIVLPFLLQHGLQGWCPPLPLLRHLGFRTRQEIDQEKHALLALQ